MLGLGQIDQLWTPEAAQAHLSEPCRSAVTRVLADRRWLPSVTQFLARLCAVADSAGGHATDHSPFRGHKSLVLGTPRSARGVAGCWCWSCWASPERAAGAAGAGSCTGGMPGCGINAWWWRVRSAVRLGRMATGFARCAVTDWDAARRVVSRSHRAIGSAVPAGPSPPRRPRSSARPRPPSRWRCRATPALPGPARGSRR
jgi:hypothetical protein